MTITENTHEVKLNGHHLENREEEFDEMMPTPKATPQKEQEVFKCGDYYVNTSGVYYAPPKKGDEQPNEPIWISSPIFPIAYLRDVDGKNHSLLIKVFDGEIDHLWPIPRSLILKWSEISEVLLGLGQELPVYPADQKHLHKFLMRARPEKKMRCVDKAGWHGNQYVFPDGEVIGKEELGESVYPTTQLCPEGIKQSGTLEEWQDNVAAPCKRNSRMILSVGVAFAAPCAELVNEDSGGINLKGSSSIGKTRCLMVSASVFGSPKYMKTWKTTGNALEGTCALYNDALLPLDEFGQAEAKEVGEIAYMVSQGQGKGRMRSNITLQKLKFWRVLVISTGEVGLSEHMQEKGKKTKAGQATRFADVPAQVKDGHGCFECIHNEKTGADFADKIKDVCSKYYGTASREFIRHLVKKREEYENYLKYCVDDFVADNSQGCDGQVARVARRFGLIYASLSLAIKLGILGGHISDSEAKEAIVKCFNAWLEGRGTKGSLESHQGKENVIGTLLEFSDSRFKSFQKNKDEEHKTFQQIWGYKDDSTFYIYPAAWTGHICHGVNATEVAKILHEDGLLTSKDKEGKYSMLTHIPSLRKSTRVYIVQVKNEEPTDD